ncbi:MAG TPA: tyrosine-type recombinase/integrase [Geobacteraceae bacterium]
MANPNHPRKGDIIRVEGFRDLKDVKNIRKLLHDRPRDLCIFTLGLNFALRGGDLLSLRVGQVRGLKTGDILRVRESKTKKVREIVLNKVVYDAVQGLLKSMGDDVSDDAYLFQSRKGHSKLTTPYLNALVKSWGKMIGLKCNLGAHSMRKGFGTINRLVHGVDVATLMRIYGHSSQTMTLRYLGITEEEVMNVYMRDI